MEAVHQDPLPIIKEMAEAKIAQYNPDKKEDESEWEGE
jgi:hypothetical protein